MKLLPQYERHQPIYNEGYTFNVEDEVFFVDIKKQQDFKLPPGYEHWKTEVVDFSVYLSERLKEMDLKPEDYTLKVRDPETDQPYDQPLLVNGQRGDIEIVQVQLGRSPYTYDVDEKKGKKRGRSGNRIKINVQRRLSPWHESLVGRRYDFSEARIVPFWPPSTVDRYENDTKGGTFIITEGQLKALKAASEGIDIAGLTSTTHGLEGAKGAKAIHSEIIDDIGRREVERVVILWDGDARDISLKALNQGEDISKRPNVLKNEAIKIAREIRKYVSVKKVAIFFAMVNPEYPKGIDDLLIEYKKQKKEILREIDLIGSMPCKYFLWEKIDGNIGEKLMNDFFQFTSVRRFYDFHRDKIGTKDFVFFGSTYQVNEHGEPEIKVHQDLKKYMLIGTNYFRLVERGIPDKEGNTIGYETVLRPWKSEIIREQHKIKKDQRLTDYIETYLGFVNRASHVNFQQVVDNHWNLYVPVSHDPQPGDFPTIRKILKHLFEEHHDNDMIYDYLTVMYCMPYEKLPIIVLYSEEEGTGKSRFLALLRMLFGQNVIKISPMEFMGNWTDLYSNKLVVYFEEAIFDKQPMIEKLKDLSMADKIMRSERFVASDEIDCIMKFVINSNHKNVLKLTSQSSRFWVREVKRFEGKPDPMTNEKMREEIPAFVHFLSTREITHPRVDRMWFSPEQYKTSIFYEMVQHSLPAVVKTLKIRIEDLFLANGQPTLEMTLKDIREHFRISERSDDNYLRDCIKKYLPHTVKKSSTTYSFVIPHPVTLEHMQMKGRGKPFVFLREDFTTEPDIKQTMISFKS